MYVPLKVPPGVYKNGTQYQSSGRWYDANLVRWYEGTLRPIGGWNKKEYPSGGTTYTDIQVTGVMRGSHAWRSNDAKAWLSAGGAKKLYAIEASVAPYNITPFRETGSLSNAFSIGFLVRCFQEKDGFNLCSLRTIFEERNDR